MQSTPKIYYVSVQDTLLLKTGGHKLRRQLQIHNLIELLARIMEATESGRAGGAVRFDPSL